MSSCRTARQAEVSVEWLLTNLPDTLVWKKAVEACLGNYNEQVSLKLYVFILYLIIHIVYNTIHMYIYF